MHLGVPLRQVYAELFNDASPERMDQLFRYLDKDDTGVVDFLSWSRRIRLQVTSQLPDQPPPRRAQAASYMGIVMAASDMRLCMNIQSRDFCGANTTGVESSC